MGRPPKTFGEFGQVKFAGLALAASVWAWASPASAQTAIKIGVVDSYTGFLAGAGDEMDKGISLYVKTHQKDLPPGVTVELLKRDDTSAPDVGSTFTVRPVRSNSRCPCRSPHLPSRAVRTFGQWPRPPRSQV